MNLKNIKTRLLLWYSLVISFILIVFSFIILEVFTYQNIKTLDAKLLAVAYDIEYEIDDFLKGEGFFDEQEEFSISNLNISIYKKNQKNINVILKSSNKLEIYNFRQLNTTIFEGKKNAIRVLTFKSKKSKNVYIQVSTTMSDKLDSSVDDLKFILFLLVPIVLLFSIFVGFIFIKKALVPVKTIIDEVNNIDAKDLKKRIKQLNSNDEIDELITTFNKLLTRLEDSFFKIKRFSNDVSHELKTPLTVIKGELELGLRKSRNIDEYKKILSTTLEETESLQRVIDSLLFLSNDNQNETIKQFTNIEFDSIIIDSLSKNKKLSFEKNIEFNIKNFDEVSCKGNEVLLRVMVDNLILNAIKYSNENSSIDLSLNKNFLIVKDYGIGIKKENLEQIFERFYMVDKARLRGGNGLGLSIVKNILKLHDFTIEVDSKLNEYTSFKIIF